MVRLIGFHGRAGAGKDTAALAFKVNGTRRKLISLALISAVILAMLIGHVLLAGSIISVAAGLYHITTMNTPVVKHLSFAGPLKLACQGLFCFSYRQLYDTKEKEVVDPRWDASPRDVFQWMGTDVLRARWRDIFLKSMQYRIDEAAAEADIIVITDVRFDNEAQLIRDQGGMIIYIKRNTTTTTSTDHASEQAICIDLVNCVIHNNGTVEELHELVRGRVELFFA